MTAGPVLLEWSEPVDPDDRSGQRDHERGITDEVDRRRH
jgi:hypothetical protein